MGTRDFRNRLAPWVVGLIVLLTIGAARAEAQSATLGWDRNTEPEVTGYLLSYGTAPGAYTKTVDVGNVDTYTVTGLDLSLDYYFAVRAYDEFGLTSDYSVEAKFPAPIPPGTTVITSFTQSAGFPLLVGSPVTWTVAATSLRGPVEYQFLLFSPATGWTVAQAFGPRRSFTWTPGWNDIGSHAVQVWVRSIGSPAVYEAWIGTREFDVMASPVQITADVDFPTPPNNPVRWTATIAGSSAVNLEYKFLVLNHGTGVWSVFRDYNSSNQATWTPSALGSYTVQVWARQVGSTAVYDVWASSDRLTVSRTTAAVTSLTANATFPVQTGTEVTWTARLRGGQTGPLQYQFVRFGPLGWQIVQAYSTSPTYTWRPVWGEEGRYGLQVWIRNSGSTALYDTWRAVDMFDVVRAPLQLTVNKLSPLPPGTAVTITAQVPDTTATFEYQFWLYNRSTGTWTNARPYGPSGSFTWTPSATGTYLFQVWARKVGSTAEYDVWRGTDYIDVAVGPARMVSLTADAALPASAGTAITWTAQARGGTAAPLQYKFLLYTEGVGWTVLRDWATANTYTWNTTGANVGQHVVQVWVRSTGFTAAAYEDWRGTDYFFIQ